jgi:hypothetical protein
VSVSHPSLTTTSFSLDPSLAAPTPTLLGIAPPPVSMFPYHCCAAPVLCRPTIDAWHMRLDSQTLGVKDSSPLNHQTPATDHTKSWLHVCSAARWLCPSRIELSWPSALAGLACSLVSREAGPMPLLRAKPRRPALAKLVGLQARCGR